MEEFLKNRYGIDLDTRLSDGSKNFRVGDLVNMLRESGEEKNVIHNLHNSALNKEQALVYLKAIKDQVIEGQRMN